MTEGVYVSIQSPAPQVPLITAGVLTYIKVNARQLDSFIETRVIITRSGKTGYYKDLRKKISHHDISRRKPSIKSSLPLKASIEPFHIFIL